MRYFSLFLCFLFLSHLSAQVGINNPNPSQALDVGGKIKVGNDEIAPVAGTIRYNRVTGTFEGYDGTEWSVFNPVEDGGSGTLPSGTVVSSRVSLAFSSGAESVYASFKDVLSGTSFTSVPAGRTLFISYMSFMPSSNSTGYMFDIYPESPSGQAQFADGIGVVEKNAERNQELTEENGFLLVIPSGGKLSVNKTEGRAFIFLRGFLQ